MAGSAWGGASLTVTRFAGQVSSLPEGLGFGGRETLEIAGLEAVQLEYDDQESRFGSIVAQVDQRTSMSLIGGLPRDELVEIAGALRFGDGDDLEVELDLDGLGGRAAR